MEILMTVSTITPVTTLAENIAARAEGKTGIKNLMEGRGDVYRVNPFVINVKSGFNVRDFDSERMKARISELAASIVANGVRRPLKVRMDSGNLVLVDGECRLRAVMYAINELGAEIRTVPVLMAYRAMSEAEATLSIMIENDSMELSVLEKSEIVSRLENFGWDSDDIASKIGVTVAYAKQLSDMSGMPEEVKEMIRENVISATLALSITRECEFDETSIMEAISKGQEAAEAAGSTRITARRVSDNVRKSFKTDVREIMADTSRSVTDDEVTITLNREAAERLFALLKMEI